MVCRFLRGGSGGSQKLVVAAATVVVVVVVVVVVAIYLLDPGAFAMNQWSSQTAFNLGCYCCELPPPRSYHSSRLNTSQRLKPWIKKISQIKWQCLMVMASHF